ncbi:signal peptidase I [Microbacterium sp. No. 7]|uniref:signal peptidase I n=1 Tax=Microbacterium sp. No. 7 TaxID=1714373 RepID=UPI0006CFD922|nr:signal peptidase I [Microbacterium sp. No. 7]ALJ19032.1 hypothetical protein AOA12_03550 [Microbacterium sp. No. 7]
MSEPAPQPTPSTPPQRPLWRRITRSTWFHLFAAFVVFGLVLNFVAKPYLVPSESMEETLQIGDRILVNRLAYIGGGPSNGDVIVFDADAAWDGERPAESNPIKAVLRWIGEVSGFGPSGPHTLVKRVIGTPGQTVECCDDDGAVLVDGVPLDEPYVFEDLPFRAGTSDCSTEPKARRCFGPVVVPADSYLMLGDHRSRSADSASMCRFEAATDDCWAWASRSSIVGKASAILWPIGRWGGID